MAVSLNSVETFFDNHAKNTTKNFMSNHFSPIQRLVRDCLELQDNADIVPCLKDHADVIGKVKNTYTNLNTIKFYLQAIVWLVTHHPNLGRKIGKRATNAYTKAWEVSKAEQMLDKAEQPKPTYPRYDTIQAAVDKKYGVESMESLFVAFYRETTKRLDYMDIHVVPSKNLAPEKGNFIAVQSSVVVFREYNKTSKKYGDTEMSLSKPLMKKVKASLTKEPRNLLFRFSVKNQSLAIRRILQGAGYEDGNLNFLRHSVASQPMTAEERVETARRAGHSIATNINTYMGKIEQPEPFLSEEE